MTKEKHFTVVSRGDSISDAFKYLLMQRLSSHNWVEDNDNPEIVIFIGGDGTMLKAFHQYVHLLDSTYFVGFNTGHLGFYSDWKQEEIDQFIQALLYQEPKIVNYPLVEMEVNNEKYYALNEIAIKNADKTFVADIKIKDEKFETFRGDGLCISSPSGSTAYNKSLNGSVVHPSFECIQLSEMGSLNNKVYRTLGSSMILPKHHNINIICESSFEDLTISCDHLSIKIPKEEKAEFLLYVSEQKVSFLRYREHTFWNRVKDSFI